MNNLTSLPTSLTSPAPLSNPSSDCVLQRVRQGEGARGEQGRVHAAQGEGKVGPGNERVSE